MKSYLQNHLGVALHAFLIFAVIFFSAWYIDAAHANIEEEISERIQKTNEIIKKLAETTDRNGADSLTEQIISDCPRRSEFEEVLNKLDALARRDLIVAQQLFESCGSFFSERKAFMVAQLKREFKSLEDDLSMLEILRDLNPHEVSLRKWGELIDAETRRSDLLTEQTDIQGKIIELLIQGNSNPQIIELVREAQNVSETLTVTDSQIDTLRSLLAS